MRARVKAARAMVASTPGLTETPQRDRRKAVTLYARYGVTEGLLRYGVPSQGGDGKDVAGPL